MAVFVELLGGSSKYFSNLKLEISLGFVTVHLFSTGQRNNRQSTRWYLIKMPQGIVSMHFHWIGPLGQFNL